MEVKDLVDNILPRTKQILLNSEQEFKTQINNWLNKKGFLVRFVGKNLVDPIWQLITGPLLPVIVENVILIVLGLVAPQVVPFVPLIIKVLEYISNNMMSEEDKRQFIELLHLVQSYQPAPEIAKALNMGVWETTNILNTQEYFDGKP